MSTSTSFGIKVSGWLYAKPKNLIPSTLHSQSWKEVYIIRANLQCLQPPKDKGHDYQL